LGDALKAAGAATSERFVVVYRLEPENPTVGTTFNLRGRVCLKEHGAFAGVVTAAADMPEHGHAMNYQPSVKMEPGTGEFIAEGFVLHMPGRWRFQFKIADDAYRETLYVEHLAK